MSWQSFEDPTHGSSPCTVRKTAEDNHMLRTNRLILLYASLNPLATTMESWIQPGSLRSGACAPPVVQYKIDKRGKNS